MLPLENNTLFELNNHLQKVKRKIFSYKTPIICIAKSKNKYSNVEYTYLLYIGYTIDTVYLYVFLL